MRTAEQTVCNVMIGAAVIMTIITMPIGHGTTVDEMQFRLILASGPIVLLTWMLGEKSPLIAYLLPLSLIGLAIMVPTDIMLAYITDLGARIAMLASLGLCILTRPGE